MAEWKIYHRDGSPLTDVNGKEITTRKVEYSGKWMDECFVSISFRNEVPIDFSIGDYIDYRDERFEINYDPGKIKCSRPDTYGEAFKYNEVKFNALMDELVRAEFLDVVLYDNQIHYTSLPKFAFYIESLDDLLDRIQANMNEQYGDGLWHFFSRNKARSVQRGCSEADWIAQYGEGTEDNVIESQSLSASSNTCWEALAWVNSTFDVNFIIRGRNVYVGTAGIPTANIFKYGKNNGLYELEQNAESDQLICTRLRAYGSTKNLPSRYYATLNGYPFLKITSDYKPSSTDKGLSVLLENISGATAYSKAFTVETYNNGSNTRHCSVTCRIDDYKFLASVEVVKLTNGCTVRLLIEKDASTSSAVKTKIDAGFTDITFVEGANKKYFPGNRINYATENLPDNMAISTLMLPGFPNQTLQDWWDEQTKETRKRIYSGDKKITFSNEIYRPYVDSPNKKTIGIRPASVFFDTDDEVNGIIEIYPTIEEMEVDGVRIDEISTGSEYAVTDNGVFNDGDTVPNFAIYLKKEVNFDITNLKNDDFTLHMKDGMCGGRDFKVAATTKDNGRWKLTLERQHDEDLDLYFPYKDFPIKAGDHFVLTGIELPDEYVQAASQKLLKYAIAYLNENDYTRYVYNPKVDEIFMARQHDKALADTTGETRSLYLTLKEGDVMLFQDEDLGIDAEICIDQLSIKEEDGKIPTYEITLREDKEVGTIKKIQNQVSSLITGNGGSGAGVTNAQLKKLFETYGNSHFLSSTDPDTAAGKITFEDGLNLGSESSGMGLDKDGNATLQKVTGTTATFDEISSDTLQEYLRTLIGGMGYDLYVDEQGKSHLWVDELMVRVKAYFAALEIRKISYSGGTTIFSNAGSTICKVVSIVSEETGEVVAYKCYARADDGETATMNWWKVGDQALCQTFNIKSGRYDGVENKHYWRLVIGVGQETLDDGYSYDYVLLSNVEAFTAAASVVPTYFSHLLAINTTPIVWSNTEVGVQTMEVGGLDYTLDLMYQSGEITYDEYQSLMGQVFYGTDSKDAPAAGDVIVQAGSQMLASQRGHAIVLSTSVEDDSTKSAPAIRMYHGISSFAWTGLTCVISPEKVKFNTDRFELFSGDDDENSAPMVVNLGVWLAGTQYAYYNEVSYGGQLWLWANKSSLPVVGECPCVAHGWTLIVSKGSDGANGEMSEIVVDSSLAIMSADNEGGISSLDEVSGLPAAVSVNKGGVVIPCSKWTADNCYVSFNGVTTSLDGRSPVVALGINPTTFTSGDDGATIGWTFYSRLSGGSVTAVGGNITIHIEYTDDDDKTVTLEKVVGVGVTRDGEKGDDGTSVEATPSVLTVSTLETGFIKRAVRLTFEVVYRQGDGAAVGVPVDAVELDGFTDDSVTKYEIVQGTTKDASGALVYNAVKIRPAYIEMQTVTASDGTEIKTYVNTATVTAAVTIGGVTRKVTVPVFVDFAKYTSTVIKDQKELVSNFKKYVGEDGTVLESTIRQTAEEISATVTDGLSQTGIDITNHTINVTADNFNIENNSGERTFSVDEEGYVHLKNLLMSGLSWKSIAEISSVADAEAHGDTSVDTEIDTTYFFPSPKQLCGVYRFGGDLGCSEVQVEMPFMSYNTGDDPGWRGAETEDEAMMLRCIAGNKVIVKNVSENYTIYIPCFSMEFEDQWVKMSSASKAAASSGTTSSATPVNGQIISDNPFSGNTGNTTPITPQKGSDGSYYMYVGRARSSVTLELTAGMMACLECVCEIVGGYETVRWTGGVGYGWGFSVS